jgi:hypothetical protein
MMLAGSLLAAIAEARASCLNRPTLRQDQRTSLAGGRWSEETAFNRDGGDEGENLVLENRCRCDGGLCDWERAEVIPFLDEGLKVTSGLIRTRCRKAQERHGKAAIETEGERCHVPEEVVTGIGKGDALLVARP